MSRYEVRVSEHSDKKIYIYNRLWDCYNKSTLLPVACKVSQAPQVSFRQFNVSGLARHLSVQGEC